jgi:site-specific DNA-methyltransferase (adenine-specific)
MEGECHPGYLLERVAQRDKHHMTGKPTGVMRALVRLCPPGGVVLDPFAGSGTSLVAAALEGRRGLGFEVTAHYAKVARDRIAAARVGLTVADSAAGQAPLWATEEPTT